jgi:hypothetical protein
MGGEGVPISADLAQTLIDVTLTVSLGLWRLAASGSKCVVTLCQPDPVPSRSSDKQPYYYEGLLMRPENGLFLLNAHTVCRCLREKEVRLWCVRIE